MASLLANMAENPAVNDPEVLETLYWHEGLSMWRIAQRLGVAETTVYRRMREFGIDRRGAAYDSYEDAKYGKVASYYVKNGYAKWRLNFDIDDKTTTTVHQLTAIAHGADPHEVYSDEKVVHHKNGVRWDNRPDNLELMSKSDHGKHHADNGDLKLSEATEWYSDEELLSWIDAFVDEFGVVPSTRDAKNWPGPATQTYRARFGSWPSAVKEAGYEPRAIQHNKE